MDHDDTITYRGEFCKLDDERRLAFGWAYVARKADGAQVVDHSGDVITPDDWTAFEDAAYDYVIESRDADEMHERRGVGTLVESIVMTPEKAAAMGMSDGDMPLGWWTGFRITDDGVWAKIKDGTYPAFSITGVGRREPVSAGGDE